MILIVFLAIILVLACLPVRVLLLNLKDSLFYALKDGLEAFKHRSWRVAPVGFIHAYTGLFGMGKTLSSVKYVVDYYNRYNNRRIYDVYKKKFVMQYVNVLSNVHLEIPYTEFYSLSQIVKIAEDVQQLNEEHSARFVTIVLGDEFSVQLNSRNFKSNLDPLTLSTILTCRHHAISLIYTAQRFQHVDALLRQVTERVIECKKLWRVECLNFYDAWQLENASSSTMIKPLRRQGFFILDKHFHQYDSIATVANFIKDYHAGAMISEERILQLQGVTQDQTVNREKRRLFAKKKDKQ